MLQRCFPLVVSLKYINGVTDFTRTSGVYSSLNASSTKSITSGLTTGLSPFPGKIAISRIYNKALTDAEVLQNYNVQKSRFLITKNNLENEG